MTNQTILKHVRAEIENIKLFATKTQIKKLNFDTLNPEHTEKCIYGQMTGDCESPKAHNLIDKCCTKLTVDIDRFVKSTRPVREFDVNFSFLEAFIYNYTDNNKNIIDYLKGATDKLKLSMHEE
jgi:hypothetical protein